MSNDQQIESAILSAGLMAPRIKPEDLTANIVDTEFVMHVSKGGQVLRWAVLTTRSGYAVVGKPSVAVSPANDNEQIGRQVAYDNSRNELWPLMGYELKERLSLAVKLPPITGDIDAGGVKFPMPDGSTVTLTRAQPPAHVAPAGERVSSGTAHMPGVTMITFDGFLQYGREHGTTGSGNMPWSFTYMGNPVSHENDKCYLISIPDGKGTTLRFTPDHVLYTLTDGQMELRPAL
jgi:hypothetical protein